MHLQPATEGSNVKGDGRVNTKISGIDRVHFHNKHGDLKIDVGNSHERSRAIGVLRVAEGYPAFISEMNMMMQAANENLMRFVTLSFLPR